MITKLFATLWETITNPFMINTPSVIRDNNGVDTGLRGNLDGSLTVDKTVFYNRPEVRKLLKNISESTVALRRKK